MDDLKTILQEFQIVNPILISDGGGQYPDTYKLSERDVQELADRILKTPKP